VTDIKDINEERVKEALAEVKDNSDMHIPVFASSILAGGSGVALVASSEKESVKQTGVALTGLGVGLSLAEVAAMAHNIMIEDRGGQRAFLLHHDAAGIIAIILGAIAVVAEDIPDEFGSFLIGLGSGAILHHAITELSLEFSDKSLEEVAESII